jgi:hypothetical protein
MRGALLVHQGTRTFVPNGSKEFGSTLSVLRYVRLNRHQHAICGMFSFGAAAVILEVGRMLCSQHDIYEAALSYLQRHCPLFGARGVRSLLTRRLSTNVSTPDMLEQGTLLELLLSITTCWVTGRRT